MASSEKTSASDKNDSQKPVDSDRAESADKRKADENGFEKKDSAFENADLDASDHTDIPLLSDDLKDDLQNFLAVANTSKSWLGGIARLARLELSQSVVATRRLLAYQLLLIPAAILFYVSLCVSIAWIAYHETQSVYWTVAVLMLTQILFLVTFLYLGTRAKRKIGFKHTSTHLKGVKDELFKTFK